MRLTLRDGGQFKKIMHGRKWIGRVYKVRDIDDPNKIMAWVGKIGEHEYRSCRSEQDAFLEVAARFFGHASHADLMEHNRRVRCNTRNQRARARHAVSEMLAGNFGPFDDMLLRSK
jgi:hypothetical protein